MWWMCVVFAHSFPFVPLEFTAICMVFFIRLALNSVFSFFPVLLALFLSLALLSTTLFIDSHGHNYVSYVWMGAFSLFLTFCFVLVWFGFISTLASINTVIVVVVALSSFSFALRYYTNASFFGVSWPALLAIFRIFLLSICLTCVNAYMFIACIDFNFKYKLYWIHAEKEG